MTYESAARTIKTTALFEAVEFWMAEDTDRERADRVSGFSDIEWSHLAALAGTNKPSGKTRKRVLYALELRALPFPDPFEGLPK